MFADRLIATPQILRKDETEVSLTYTIAMVKHARDRVIFGGEEVGGEESFDVTVDPPTTMKRPARTVTLKRRPGIDFVTLEVKIEELDAAGNPVGEELTCTTKIRMKP